MARRRAGGNPTAISASVGRAKQNLSAAPQQGVPHIPVAPAPHQPRATSATEAALDPRFRKNYRRRIQPRDDAGFRWQDPMPSSNPARPRTLEAGYNAEQRTLRVVFRDGTPYSYYGVEPVTWQRFKRSASPGRFINRVLNSYPYERGDWEPPNHG